MTVDSRVYTLTVTVTDNGEGQLTAVKSLTYKKDGETVTADDVIASFKNTYNAQGEATVEAKKELEGKVLAKNQFTFTLTPKSAMDADGKTITDPNAEQTATNDANGNVSFTKLSYTTAGTYVYEVQETGQDEKGITIDRTIYQVTVRVFDQHNGSLGTEVTYKNLTTNQNTTAPITFKNKYATKNVETSLEGEKKLVDEDDQALDLKDRVFEFAMTLTSAKDGTTDRTSVAPASRTAKNKADGKIIFDKLTFTAPGVYVYTVSETTATANGVTKDVTVYTVTYTVTDNGEGSLVLARKIQKESATVDGIIFTNRYATDSTSVDVKAKKRADGTAAESV